MDIEQYAKEHGISINEAQRRLEAPADVENGEETPSEGGETDPVGGEGIGGKESGPEENT